MKPNPNCPKCGGTGMIPLTGPEYDPPDYVEEPCECTQRLREQEARDNAYPANHKDEARARLKRRR